MKDSKFSAEYTNAVNNISLPADYKEKILSALREEDKKLQRNSSEKNTEIIELTNSEDNTFDNPYNTEKTTKRTKFNIKKFIPAVASVAAAIVLVIAAVLLLSRKPLVPTETTFNFSVASATNLGNISGARLVFKDSSGELLKDEDGEVLTAYTDANGNVSVTLPSTEEYTAQVTVDGYIAYETSVQNKNIYISPVMNEDTYRAVLTWEKDCDLDAILTMTKGEEKEQLFYFKSDIKDEQGQVIAALDVDSQTASAPETITFNATEDAIFRYSVASYSALKESDDNNLTASGALVTLYKGDKLVGKYKVPESTLGNAWCLFEINDSQLEIKNEIYSVDAIIDVK
ncbi:MAG: hypothetical protein E7566_07940 [Ruminococcaceae bacterium]|nr:hypothetical protein [Oscillospiraceae bacterium]